MTTALVKFSKPKQFDVDGFLWSMFVLYASRPSKRTCEPDASWFIGDVNDAPQKNWTRLTPYSPSEPLR